jgi:hypothetical protein
MSRSFFKYLSGGLGAGSSFYYDPAPLPE